MNIDHRSPLEIFGITVKFIRLFSMNSRFGTSVRRVNKPHVLFNSGFTSPLCRHATVVLFAAGNMQENSVKLMAKCCKWPK